MKSMNCESCGAPLEIENQFIRSVTCQFCGSAYVVSGDDGLDMKGKTASLANYPSRLSVGQTGKIKGKGFSVMGRVRYSYDEGFWEEWQVNWDDDTPPDWLEEDEGYWTLYRRERVRSAIPTYSEIRVGSTVQVNKYNVFVTEKREGQMMGSEGQFSSVLPIQGKFGFFSGNADGKIVSINYWDDEIELSVGEDLEHSDMVLS